MSEAAAPIAPVEDKTIHGEPAVGYVPDQEEMDQREKPDMADLLATVRRGETLGYASGEEPSTPPVLPAVGLGAAAFVIVGLFLWAGRGAMHFADGMKDGLSHGASREVVSSDKPDTTGTYGRSVTSAAARVPIARSPAAPGAVYRPGGSLHLPAPPAAPPVAANLLAGPFLGQGERALAKASLGPLHDMLSIIRKWDSGVGNRGGSPSLPADPNARPAAPNNTGVAPVTFAPPGAGSSSGGGGGRGALFMANTSGTSAANAPSAGRIAMETEALEAEVALVAHSDQFAEPLQPGVKEFRKELTGYLVDTQLAVSAEDQQKTTLRNAANRRLNRAQSLLSYLDGVVEGTTPVEKMP